MIVREIMKTEIITIPYGTPYREVAKILLEKRVSGAPVVDERGQLVGVVSEKDLFKAIYPSYNDFYSAPSNFIDFDKLEQEAHQTSEKRVEDFMSPRLITTTPETPILKVGAIMVATGIHRVPVLENGKLIGMVSRGDVYRAILREYFEMWEIK